MFEVNPEVQKFPATKISPTHIHVQHVASCMTEILNPQISHKNLLP